MATKSWPQSVNSTIFTEPGGPLGESVGSVLMPLTRESGKMPA
jgi:hypothetical protein